MSGYGQRLVDKDAPRRGSQFVDYAANCSDHLPSYWTKGNTQISGYCLTHSLVPAGPRSSKAIEDLIRQTYDSSLVGQGRDSRGLESYDVEVISVERLENPGLFRKYSEERRKFFAQSSARGRLCPRVRKLPGSEGRIRTMELLPNFMKRELYWEVNEQYLFHGTKAESIQSILSNGLDPSYGSLGGMFGQAVYTAESFTKADQYTDSRGARTSPGTELYMILARVLLGRVYVCTSRQEISDLHGPPCTSCHVHDCYCTSPNRFDSVMADADWNFREFVVHHSYRCYPEYIIKYKRI